MTRQISPKLVVSDAAGAIDFYRRALDAVEIVRYTAGDTVVFAEIEVLGSRVTLKDADSHDPVPDGPGPILDILVEDPDDLAEQMLRAGASEVFAMSDQPFGGRWGRIVDPYGVQWLLQTEITMDPAEVQAIVDRMG